MLFLTFFLVFSPFVKQLFRTTVDADGRRLCGCNVILLCCGGVRCCLTVVPTHCNWPLVAVAEQVSRRVMRRPQGAPMSRRETKVPEGPAWMLFIIFCAQFYCQTVVLRKHKFASIDFCLVFPYSHTNRLFKKNIYI